MITPNTNANQLKDNTSSNDYQHNSKRLRRGRSSRACLSCRKRKVRCDITKKNHPFEKCTNCYEFSVDCQVIDKVTKLIVSSILPSSEMNPITNLQPTTTNHHIQPQPERYQNQNQNQNQYQHQYQYQYHQYQYQYQQQTLPEGLSDISTSSYFKIQADKIHLDPEKFVSKGITKKHITESLKNSTPSYYLKFAIDEFMLSKDGFDKYFVLNNEILIRSMSFNDKEICTLPSYDKCQKYINNFLKINRIHGIVNEVSFLRNYSDLRNPPSFLLLRCVLYIGSMMCDIDDETFDDNNSPEMLFQRARILYNMGIELMPVPLVQSLILLSLCPERESTLFVDRIEYLNTAMSTAIHFSMNLDHSQDKHLTEEEKLTYKTLFWYLFIQDKFLSLTTNRSYKLRVEDCTVSKLTREEFLSVHFGQEISPKASLFVEFFNSLDRFCDLMIQVTKAQTAAYKLGFQCSLVHHIFTDIINTIDNWYNDSPEILKNEKSSSSLYHILKIFRNILKFSVLDSAILFRTQLVRKCTRYESKSLREVIFGMDLSSYQLQCILIFHDTINILPGLINMEQAAHILPHLIKILLHIAISSSFGLFHTNLELRNSTRNDFAILVKLYPVIISKCFDNSGSTMIKTGEYFFKTIYPDENRLTKFLRDTFGSDIIECLLSLDFDVLGDTIPFEPDFKELVKSCISNIGPPIFNLNETKIDFSLSSDELQKQFMDIYTQDQNLTKDYVIQFGTTRPVDKMPAQFERFLPHVDLLGSTNFTEDGREALAAFNFLGRTNFHSTEPLQMGVYSLIDYEKVDLSSTFKASASPIPSSKLPTLSLNIPNSSYLQHNQSFNDTFNNTINSNYRIPSQQQAAPTSLKLDALQIPLQNFHIPLYSSPQQIYNEVNIDNNTKSVDNSHQIFDDKKGPL